VSHDRDLAFGVADKMAIIHEGSILAVGSPAAIRASSDPLVQRFLTVQFNHEKPQ
jgi:phospholipid/cholesterol/gamma-HCH transport system ATP-binding protein